MNRILFILVVVAACFLGQSCDQDPYFEFKDAGKVYFKYPRKLASWGTESNYLVDSVVYSSHGKELHDDKDTLWIKVEIMGARENFDRQYKVVAVADSSTAKERRDFEELLDTYTFHRNVGVDSFPLVINKKAMESVYSRRLLLKLESTDDLGVAFIEFSTLRVMFSIYRLEPNWWNDGFGMLLGDYHPLKYDKVVEVYGSEEIDIYGSYPYCTYVGNMVKLYFKENEVIDPFTGNRLLCNEN